MHSVISSHTARHTALLISAGSVGSEISRAHYKRGVTVQRKTKVPGISVALSV